MNCSWSFESEGRVSVSTCSGEFFKKDVFTKRCAIINQFQRVGVALASKAYAARKQQILGVGTLVQEVSLCLSMVLQYETQF